MSKELDDLRAERDHAKQQAEVWKHREERAEQRVKYQRSAKDRKRTHHLIQYGAAFECHYKELPIWPTLMKMKAALRMMNQCKPVRTGFCPGRPSGCLT